MAVVGGPHAHMAEYEYSAALKAKQGPWTYDELYQWLKKPAAYAPGTKMTFAGVDDPKQTRRCDRLSALAFGQSGTAAGAEIASGQSSEA